MHETPFFMYKNLFFEVLSVIFMALPVGSLSAQGLEPQGRLEKFSNSGDVLRLQGVLKIDAGSGMTCLDFPLGPGIGGPGLRYVPILMGQFAPRVGLVPLPPSTGESELCPALLATTAFKLSPGTLDCWIICESPSEGTARGPLFVWTYPDGTHGRMGGTLPQAIDPDVLRARFGYKPAAGSGDLPSRLGAPPAVSVGLPGIGGEILLGLSDDVRFPPQAVSSRVDRDGKPIQWMVPSGLLVIRGPNAYEYSFSEYGKTEPGKAIGFAHYRLTAIRNDSGEQVIFTYGSNGVDFDAEWQGIKVRVTLDGVAPIPPAPALDDALAGIDPAAPDFAFRSIVVRLRITYEGLPDPLSYSVTALARPEFRRPDGGFAGGFRSAVGPGDTLHDSFHRNLQVNMVRNDLTGDYLRFVYRKAAGIIDPGNETRSFAPTILQEVGHPGRSIRLTWAGQPIQGPSVEPGATSTAGGPWTFGVCQVEDRDLTGPVEKLITHKLNLLCLPPAPPRP